jgi:proteasome lid subunit RPN8/RPN11
MGIFNNLKKKVKDKAVEKMLEKQMGNLPEEQKQALMGMMEDNPEFFEDIAKEIEREVKSGKSQMAASMSVMRKHQAKMQQMMMNAMGGDPRMKDKNLR